MKFTFGGGCFWCIDAVYRKLRGVTRVTSGYSGGHDTQPNYYRVASGETGHAEVVQIEFDETIIPAEIVLDIFFLIHDPTTLNRQGADMGAQYRSVLFYDNVQQKNQYEEAISRAQNNWDNPIVTTLEPLESFYPAEDEHQDYFDKQPASGYCSIVIQPKIVKARGQYAKWFKTDQ